MQIICENEGKKFCQFCEMPLHIKSKEIQRRRRKDKEKEMAELVAAGKPLPEDWKAALRLQRLLEWDRTQVGTPPPLSLVLFTREIAVAGLVVMVWWA